MDAVESKLRTYARAQSVAFQRTGEPFGGLSNMASGFSIEVSGIPIRSSEALYQACRFPTRPDIQELILAERSPMSAKMRSKPYRSETRSDWDLVRVPIMKWCLRVKFAQNAVSFGSLLLETGSAPIVEESRKDQFWGAKANDAETLVGENVLGRLLMELRDIVRGDERALEMVSPPPIEDFLLVGRPIDVVLKQSIRDGDPMRVAA